MIPAPWLAEIRALVQCEVRLLAATREEHLALRRIVQERICNLSMDDTDALVWLIEAMQQLLAPDQYVLAADLVRLAHLAQGPAGDALRLVVVRYADKADPAKALGRFLTRVCGVPKRGVWLKCITGETRSAPNRYGLSCF